MSGMFKQIEGDSAIIVEGGVYKHADLYTRGDYLFAKTGGGFVRLYADGSTSKPKCRIDTLATPIPLFRDNFGRLCDGSVKSSVPIEPEKAVLLLGAPQ